MIEKMYRVEIRASAKRVWEEITRGGGPNHPMFGTWVHGEFTPGSVLTYRSKAGDRTFVMGKVLEVVPERRLVHTFRFAMEDDAATLVTWELQETAGATHVTVSHSKLVEGSKTLKGIDGGWPRILALYKATVEQGRAPLWPRCVNSLMGLMSFMLPAKTRTEAALKVDLNPPAGEGTS